MIRSKLFRGVSCVQEEAAVVWDDADERHDLSVAGAASSLSAQRSSLAVALPCTFEP
jgi:hypothetical protein